jgi:putative ABC transport system permease protein
MNDLKFAFRQLLKNPGFTVVAVLTLALGIGINTGIFNILNAVVFRSLPVQGSARLVRVFQSFAGNRGPVHRNVYGDPNRVSYSEYRAYRDNGFHLGMAMQPSKNPFIQ